VDINEYISSGILELYVAGALDPEQMREVGEVAARHSQIRDEIAAIEEAVAAMARTDRNPSPELRSTIIRRIAELGEEGAPRQGAVPRPPTMASLPRAMRYMLAAAIAVAILSSGLAIYYWIEWQRTRMELVDAQQQQRKTIDEVESYKARYEEANGMLTVLRSPGNRVVDLHGTPNAPAASARVYWNSATSETTIDVAALPKPPAGRQYQLWAIGKRGPADAGLIARDGAAAMQKMKDVAAGATAFAVTLEPEGGRPSPTLDQIVVTGELPADDR
jgi:anti-sigma-K factor RskA